MTLAIIIVLAHYLTIMFDSLCRSVPKHLLQRFLKSQIILLASRQQILVEIFQKQVDLVQTYVTMKARLPTQTPNLPTCTVVREPAHSLTPASTPVSSKAGEAHSCNQISQRKTNQRPVISSNLLRSGPNSVKDLNVCPATLVTQRKKISAHTNVIRVKARTCQGSPVLPGSTSQYINLKMKRRNALIQASTDDSSRHLSQLIQRGVVPPGSILWLLFKVRQNLLKNLFLLSPTVLLSLKQHFW